MSSTGGHGTGYEDAITRRIAAAEGRAKELEEKLARVESTVESLVQDNAALRRRSDADAARVRRAGIQVALAALVALACLGGLVFVMLRG